MLSRRSCLIYAQPILPPHMSIVVRKHNSNLATHVLVVVSGSIPRELGNLTKLRVLEIEKNGLTGAGIFTSSFGLPWMLSAPPASHALERNGQHSSLTRR